MKKILKKQNPKYNYFVIIFLGIIMCMSINSLNLVGVLGIGGYWANKAADAIFAGLAFWQIASLLAGDGIAGIVSAGAVWGARWMIKQLGRKAFVGF